MQPERIWLPRSRATGNKRRLVNAAEVGDCLSRHGFQALEPERFPIEEQIRIFRGARAIVAEAGSAPHNSVFSPAQTRVAIVQGNHASMFIQSSIGRLRAQPTGYLFGETFLRPGNGINGDYLLSIDILEQALAAAGAG
jgi:capsular polysaccharide biosynthesis protein